MRCGLTEEQIGQINGILKRYPAVIEAVVFGSRATGTFREGSDIDLALRGDVSPLMAAEIKFALEEDTYVPYFFDVVSYKAVDNEVLLRHIDSAGIPLFSSR